VTADKGTVQSVDRALRILRALAAGTSRLGVTELSERLGLAKGTVHGLLRTLERQEFVEQDAETGKYRLGPATLQLGNAFLDNHVLRARSLLWADSLAGQLNEAVRIGVLNGSSVLIVHHVFRPDNSVQILEVGASIPWHACALGKAIVAFADQAQRSALLESTLERLTGRTMTDPAALKRALDRIVRSGVATGNQEAIIGEAEIAAAVFDHRGAPVGAVGVAGPVERLLPGTPDEMIVAAVKHVARSLSREMGAGRLSARGG
jgi:DNA-binding IclR family transcriptional regulator